MPETSKVVTYVPVGKCECGSTEFHVDAMVKTFGSVYINQETGNVNVDISDFRGNAEETDSQLETPSDLMGSQDYQRLPERIRKGIDLSKVYASDYVVIRCDKCGTPLDYDETKPIVMGYED